MKKRKENPALCGREGKQSKGKIEEERSVTPLCSQVRSLQSYGEKTANSMVKVYELHVPIFIEVSYNHEKRCV